MMQDLKPLSAEFTGTFVLVCVISMVSVTNPLLAPLAIGFTLTVQVFAFGYVSGAHYNPAVSIGAALAGACPPKRAAAYVAVQIVGAVLGSAYALAVTDVDKLDIPAPIPADTSAKGVMRAAAAEFFFTFVLVTVVLNVACSPQKNNHFFGFAIGLTVLAGAASVGGVSGGAFNPAVSTGTQLVKAMAGHSKALGYIWMYWLSHLLAASGAAGYFRLLQGGGKDADEEAQQASASDRTGLLTETTA